MSSQLKRVLRIIFAVVGGLAFLLGVTVVVLAVVLHPPGATERALVGSLLYFGIAGACCYAVFRLTRSLSAQTAAADGD